MSWLCLVCHDGDLVSEPTHVPQHISRAHRAALVRTVRHMMVQRYQSADVLAGYLLETPLRADTMLAGIPAKEVSHDEAMLSH